MDKKDIVSLKEFVDDKSAVQVNPVVDPSASLTDPSNIDFKPQSNVELQAALQRMTQASKLSPEEAYKVVGQAFARSEERMNKVEESIRKQIRNILESLVVEAPKGIKWGQRVRSDYQPGNPEWEKATAELRASLGKMQSDEASETEKKNIMGVFTIDDIRKIFEAEGLEPPSVGGVKKIEVDAMERAKKLAPALERAEQDPEAFQQFAVSLDLPFTSLEPNEVEAAFYTLALDRAKISDDEKDAIQVALEADESSEVEQLHKEKMKKIVSSPAFEEVFESHLDDIAELSIENLVTHEKWDIVNDDDARENYIRNQIMLARKAFIGKISSMLSSPHGKEAAGVPESSWRKFVKALDEVAEEFTKFYEE